MLEIIALLVVIIAASMLWFAKKNKAVNKKLKKLLEKFECCV